MLIDSNLLQELERNAFSPKGQPMSIYGDPAYPLRIHLQAPFRHGVLTPMMEQYNWDHHITDEKLLGKSSRLYQRDQQVPILADVITSLTT